MAQPPVRCRELVESITEWMEGALADEVRLRVEEHLAICPHCRGYVAQLRVTIEALRATPPSAPPPAARAALLAAFRGDEDAGTP